MIRVSLPLVLLALAALGSVQTAAAEEPLVIVDTRGRSGSVTLEVERPDLNCDGVDATLIVATRRRENGELWPGHLQIGIPRNAEVLNASPELDEYGATVYRYDENAQLMLLVAPVNNGRGWWDLYVPVSLRTNSRAIGYHLPCPLTDDRTYTISGDAWTDDNRDGVRDAGESALSDFGLKLYCPCGYDNVPEHFQRTASDGTYEWTGLHRGGYSASSGMPWEMCLDKHADDPLAIVSVNGAPVEPIECLTIRVAAPGDLPFSLGVAVLSADDATSTPSPESTTQTPQATATRTTLTASPATATPHETETVTHTAASGTAGQLSTPAKAESSAVVPSDTPASEVLGTTSDDPSGITLPATGTGGAAAPTTGSDFVAILAAAVVVTVLVFKGASQH